jgi:hypothetical protein
VEQASVNAEHEVAHRLSVGVSYMYVHGVDLIRARDVNLPPPVNISYPVYDASGTNFLGAYYDVNSFSTVQPTRTLTCPFPPASIRWRVLFRSLDRSMFSRVRPRACITTRLFRSAAA